MFFTIIHKIIYFTKLHWWLLSNLFLFVTFSYSIISTLYSTTKFEIQIEKFCFVLHSHDILFVRLTIISSGLSRHKILLLFCAMFEDHSCLTIFWKNISKKNHMDQDFYSPNLSQGIPFRIISSTDIIHSITIHPFYK